MSRHFADRWSEDYKQGERDFERNGRPDMQREKYSRRDENYFGGYEKAQEEQERRDRERREERYQEEQEERQRHEAYLAQQEEDRVDYVIYVKDPKPMGGGFR